MTAILTWNSAFVPDCALELLSKPHILPLLSLWSIFFCQAGIKQNHIRASEFSQAFVAWSAETEWPSWDHGCSESGSPEAISASLTVQIDKMSGPLNPLGVGG